MWAEDSADNNSDNKKGSKNHHGFHDMNNSLEDYLGYLGSGVCSAGEPREKEKGAGVIL